MLVIQYEKCCAFHTRPGARSGVPVQGVVVVLEQRAFEDLGQHPHVGQRQVEARGPGRQDRVRGVTGQQQPPVPHRGLHESAERQHRALPGCTARHPRRAVCVSSSALVGAT